MEQQKLLAEAEARRAPAPSAPQFQVFSQAVAGPSKPQPLNSSPSILLRSQMGQLSLDPSKPLDRIDVLHANQVAMQQHQMGLLRKQQQEAAEANVGFSVLHLQLFFSIVSF